MEALLIGTGGADGWPRAGCRCASCMRARSAGRRRAPGRVLIDGRLEFAPYQHVHRGTRSSPSAAHRITQIPGGWDITGPDGGRMLLAAGPGQVPEPPPGTQPFDLALLDLLSEPASLGKLRAAGLLRSDATVVALYTDHRISSERELERRCSLWAVIPGVDGQVISHTPPGSRSGGSAPTQGPLGAALRPHRTLIIGGARSGKSTEAELRLIAEPQVTYLAAGPWAGAVRTTDPVTGKDTWTGPEGEHDAEWAQRVAVHQARRPAWWRTVESLDVAGALRRETGAILIDGIGTWLAAVMDEAGMWAPEQPGTERTSAGPTAAEPGTAGHDKAVQAAGPDPEEVVQARIEDLISAWRQTRALVVAVTDQVGSGLVPAYRAGRVFRDQLGWLNQRIAAESELNLQVVTGRVMNLPD